MPTDRIKLPWLYLLTILVGYCSIVYELILAQCLSVVLGNTIVRYALTIGLYLFSLGMGSLYLYFYPSQRPLRVLLIAEIILAFIGILLPAWILMGDHMLYQLLGKGSNLAEQLSWILMHACVIGIGLLSGVEVPILMELARVEKNESETVVLGLDYFATFLGAVSFPFLIYQGLGLVAGSALVGGLNALAALIIVVHPSFQNSMMKYLSLIASCLVAAVGIFSQEESLRLFLISFVFGP